jgi:hypothetical protein
MRPGCVIRRLRKPSRRSGLKARVRRSLQPIPANVRCEAPRATEPEDSESATSSEGSSSGENGSAADATDREFALPEENAAETRGESEQKMSLLDRLIDEQMEILGARNNPIVSNPRRGAGHRSQMDLVDEFSGESEDKCVGTAESRWSRYLRRLPSDFFSCPEANM